jgi:hypothetical protein
VLFAGGAWIATTISGVKKEPVAIQVLLPTGIRGLRLDVLRQAVPDHRLVEHLEWSYASPPPAQDASLELVSGLYTVTLHPIGPGRDPAPLELRVEEGQPAHLTIDLRTP